MIHLSWVQCKAAAWCSAVSTDSACRTQCSQLLKPATAHWTLASSVSPTSRSLSARRREERWKEESTPLGITLGASVPRSSPRFRMLTCKSRQAGRWSGCQRLAGRSPGHPPHPGPVGVPGQPAPAPPASGAVLPDPPLPWGTLHAYRSLLQDNVCHKNTH